MDGWMFGDFQAFFYGKAFGTKLKNHSTYRYGWPSGSRNVYVFFFAKTEFKDLGLRSC